MKQALDSEIPPAIAPMLSVKRGAEAVAFYQAAFGAESRFRFDGDDGEVTARLAVGAAEFWVVGEAPDYGNRSPESLGGSTTRLMLIVSDPDAVHAQAIAAGATVVWPVSEEYGWRLGRVVDPFGHHWEIAKPPESED